MTCNLCFQFVYPDGELESHTQTLSSLFELQGLSLASRDAVTSHAVAGQLDRCTVAINGNSQSLCRQHAMHRCLASSSLRSPVDTSLSCALIRSLQTCDVGRCGQSAGSTSSNSKLHNLFCWFFMISNFNDDYPLSRCIDCSYCCRRSVP